MSRSPLPAFSKPWLSIEEQLSRLTSRGLTVTDRHNAVKFLNHLNYYRFSGYCLAFEDSRHSFRAGTTFDQIQAAYEFDVLLRDLLTEALEVIEVDVRAAIAQIFGNKCGAFGHVDKSRFRPTFDHTEWTARLHQETERSNELFVVHFKSNYSGFPQLPCWIAMEIISFGGLSKMYQGLSDNYQTPIANRYSMQKGDLESALHHLSYVRNICAHHSRLWDRVWAITPRVPANANWQPPLIPDRTRLYVTLLIVYRILKRCPSHEAFAKAWRKRINELMKNPPATPDALVLMGMPPKWYNHPYWV